MSDINVALSSTGHILQIDGPPEIIELLKKQNYPVCVADMGLGIYGQGQEQEEHHIAELCKAMAKTVFVDMERRYVFIGEDPEIPETGLIEYLSDVDGHCIDSFFKQWGLLKSLFMEFNVLGKNGPLFSLRGLWVINEWKILDIFTHSNITVISPNEGPV